ncbi:type IV conjugative transfer system lipoprotein TraV [Vibrio mediterranei]|uniref:type IV conjugative transfer system lipoprotein TraV n=1 Tax=Vibrio mediterranei TaxID=689 RepID=UPI004068B75C
MINRSGFLLVGTVLVLSGCSIGQTEFTCSMGSESSICASSRTIYKATNGELPENETITYVEDGERKQITVAELEAINNGQTISEKTGSTAKSKYAANNDFRQINMGEPQQRTSGVEKAVLSTVTAPKVPYAFGYDGEALRSDTRVMRIWIAPWVDANDTLHMSKVIYTDMEKKKWTIAKKSQANKPQPKLLKPVVSKTTSDMNAAKVEPQKKAFVPPPHELEKIQKRFSKNTNNGE